MTMKKRFYFLAAAALALSACTSEEVIDVSTQSNAIGFEKAVMKPTRADQAVDTDLTNENLDKFIVYGFYTREGDTGNPIQIFGGEAVTKDAEGKWTYKNTRYWVPKATYNFFAYSCADVELSSTYGTIGLDLNATGANRQMIISNFRCDRFHNHDLVYAQSRDNTAKEKTDDNPAPNPNISFKFSHILSKIDCVFISEFDKDYDVVIKDVRLQNFRNIGAYSETAGWNNQVRNFDNPTQSGASVQDIEVSLPFNISGDVVARAADNSGETPVPAITPKTQSRYIIPYNYHATDVYLLFTIELYKGTTHTIENRIMSVPMKGSWSPTWEKGMYYTYSIRLTGSAANLQPIVFEQASTMDGWTVGTSTATDMSFSTN